MKKLLLVILFLVVFPTTSSAYEDIKESIFKEDILTLKSQSIHYLSDDEHYFRPNDPITRGEAALLLFWATHAHFTEGYNDWLDSHYAAFGRGFRRGVTIFHDLVEDNHYSNYNLLEISKVFAKYNVFNGYPDQTFRPNDTLTREQAAKIINASYYLPNVATTAPFTDLINDYSKQAINNLYAYGITSGTSNNTFSPLRELTRGEFASLLARMSKFTQAKTPRYVSSTSVASLNRIQENTTYKVHVEKVTEETATLLNLTSKELQNNEYYYVEFLSPVLAREQLGSVKYNQGHLLVEFGYGYLYSIPNELIAYPTAIGQFGYLLKLSPKLKVTQFEITSTLSRTIK